MDSLEKVVLVGVINKHHSRDQVKEFLNELALLAHSAGAEVKGRFTQHLSAPHPHTFINTGKLDEINTFIKNNEIDVIIFDDELSPSQVKNIEKITRCHVVDRTGLILDIFAERARTAHAKTQVELAQLEYLLPRLTGMWQHLERQRGGIGFRGPGESQIETDRRIVLQKIARLKDKLKIIDQQKSTQRANRGKLVRVAVVGYTNAGKSTLMNLLCKSSIKTEDLLFATLDTTVRKIVIENLPFLLADTVGFIRKLPHTLVESFKSTLDEVREADLLLHVVDISHHSFEEQVETVQETLTEIGVGEKPVVYAFNKIDAFSHNPQDDDDLSPKTKNNYTLEDWQQSWMAKCNEPTVFISATQKQHIDTLKAILYREVRKIHEIRYPYNDFLY